VRRKGKKKKEKKGGKQMQKRSFFTEMRGQKEKGRKKKGTGSGSVNSSGEERKEGKEAFASRPLY